MAYRILYQEQQVGRTFKSLEAAEAAVQRKWTNLLSNSGKDSATIVDEDGNIVRVFYLS